MIRVVKAKWLLLGKEPGKEREQDHHSSGMPLLKLALTTNPSSSKLVLCIFLQPFSSSFPLFQGLLFGCWWKKRQERRGGRSSLKLDAITSYVNKVKPIVEAYLRSFSVIFQIWCKKKIPQKVGWLSSCLRARKGQSKIITQVGCHYSNQP